MMTRLVRPFFAGALVMTAGLVACEGDHPSVNEPFGPASYDMRLVGVAVPKVPRSGLGNATATTFLTFDTSVADAFGRRGDLFLTQRTLTLPNIGGVGWNLLNTVRRVTVDGRVPLLVGPSTPSATHLTLQGPEAANELWRLNLAVTGLTASTTYRVGFARYSLSQNDSLDHAVSLLTATNFTAPDTLTLFGGAPSAVAAGGCTPTSAVIPAATSNPQYVGTFTTGATGAAGSTTSPLQMCLKDNNGLWYRSNAVNPNRTPIAPNSGVTFSLPQYNYIIIETTAGVPILRAQIGQDLRSSGAPINNAFAPMPCRTSTTTGQCATSGVLSSRAKISAPGGSARVDSVTAFLLGLKALSGSGVYQMWLVNPTSGAAPVAAVGRVRALEVDTVTDVPVLDTDTLSLTDSTANTSTFVGYPMPQANHVTLRVIITAASAGVALENYSHLLITAEPSGPATTPSGRRPLQVQFADPRGTGANLLDDEYFDVPVAKFGNVDLATGPSYTFLAAGSGLGGFRGDEVSIDLTALARPPEGYYYQGWLQDVNGGPGGTDTIYVPVDTLRSPFPNRVLLLDADVALVDPVVQTTPPEISASSLRSFAARLGLDPNRPCNVDEPARGACPFGDFENFLVTLEPKDSDPLSPSPTVLFVGSIPGVVKLGKAQ